MGLEVGIRTGVDEESPTLWYGTVQQSISTDMKMTRSFAYSSSSIGVNKALGCRVFLRSIGNRV
jgi:hypothetical protein